MIAVNWTEEDTERALKIWTEYQQQHDLTGKTGETAGIEPVSGSIWFGDSIEDVVAKRNAAGCSAPLFFARVGSEFYYRKGGHR